VSWLLGGAARDSEPDPTSGRVAASKPLREGPSVLGPARVNPRSFATSQPVFFTLLGPRQRNLGLNPTTPPGILLAAVAWLGELGRGRFLHSDIPCPRSSGAKSLRGAVWPLA